MVAFTLYSTEGCHLCELAEGLLTHFPAYSYTKMDIVHDENLMALYGVQIPVLKHEQSKKELAWPFDTESLGHWLSQFEEE